ncbi:hypothetical protein AOLI_G00201510 [Acnodon oligacanthus]
MSGVVLRQENSLFWMLPEKVAEALTPLAAVLRSLLALECSSAPIGTRPFESALPQRRSAALIGSACRSVTMTRLPGCGLIRVPEHSPPQCLSQALLGSPGNVALMCGRREEENTAGKWGSRVFFVVPGLRRWSSVVSLGSCQPEPPASSCAQLSLAAEEREKALSSAQSCCWSPGVRGASDRTAAVVRLGRRVLHTVLCSRSPVVPAVLCCLHCVEIPASPSVDSPQSD